MTHNDSTLLFLNARGNPCVQAGGRISALLLPPRVTVLASRGVEAADIKLVTYSTASCSEKGLLFRNASCCITDAVTRSYMCIFNYG